MAFSAFRSQLRLALKLGKRAGSSSAVTPDVWQMAPRTIPVGLASKALLTLVSVAHLAIVFTATVASTRSAAQTAAPPVVTPPPPGITLPVWPTSPSGKAPTCTGQGCADRFRDGQSMGYEILQWGVSNQSDPNRRDNLSTNAGARRDPTAQNPSGVMTTRDFMPGGATEADLDASRALQNLDNLMAISNAARDKVDEVGCRVTLFRPVTTSRIVLSVTAYTTKKILLMAATPTTAAKYETRRIATRAYNGSVPFTASFFGATPAPVIRTIIQATERQDGLQVVLLALALDQVNDGNYVPWRVGIVNTTGQITTVGTVKDNFTIRGTLNSLPAGAANVFGDVYLADRRYYQPHTQPNGVCQPDPPNCTLRAENGQTVSACSGSPYAGLLSVYDLKTKTATTDASQTLRTSLATNRTQVAGVNPEQFSDSILPGSRNTLAGNVPTFRQQPGDTYKPFNFSVNELFSGCTDVRTTTLPGSDSTRRTLDVQSCVAHLDPTTPRVCTGTRSLGFTPIGNHEIGKYTYRKTTKTASCPAGTTLNADLPPGNTGQWIQQHKNFRWSSCPAATPLYVGPAGPGWQTPVDYLYRNADASGDAWGPWTPFNNVASVCAATGTPTPAPVDSVPDEIFGTPSVGACMPGRITTIGAGSTAAPEPYTGTLNFTIRTIGSPETVISPVDPAPYGIGTFNNWQITYNRAAVDAQKNFPHNLTVTAGSGSVSGLTVTTYGSADDGWTIVGRVAAAAANDIRFRADLKYIASNDLVGCQDYMGMLADKVCVLPPPGQMTCTDNRGPSTTLNGVTFGITGPLAGIVKLIKPWGVQATATVTVDGPTDVAGGPPETYVSEPMCFAVNGPQLTCTIPGANSQTWRNHFPAEPALKGYVDNCDTRPKNSIPATTVGLLTDTACRYLGPGNCVSGATGAVSGTCYQREVLYDCGTTQVVGPGEREGDTQLVQSCSSALRCIGTECHRPISEASQDFGRVGAAGEVLNAIRHHTVCAETGKEITTDSQSCTPILFGGVENKCLSPLTAQVGVGGNCCKVADEQAGTVDFGKYVTMLTLAWRLKDTQFAQTTLQAFGNLSGVTATYNNAANAVASTLKPITDSFASVLRSLGYSPTNPAVVAKDAALAAPSGALNPISELSKLIEDKMVELLGDVLQGLGLTAGAGAAGELAAKKAAEELLKNINTVLFWYGVAQLIGSLVYSCNAAQLTPGLGLARKGGSCHFLGTRTSGSVGALERFSIYCCYSSPLARIMQENFRNGLPGTSQGTSTIGWQKAPFYGQELFGGWGNPGAPKCAGITPSQMLEIDWGKVDLSEWVDALKDNGLLPKTEAEINKRYGLVSNGTNTTFPNLGPGGTTTKQPGPNLPMDKPKAMREFMSKYSSSMNGVVDTLNPQSVCYDDPTLMAWYAPPGPQSVTDIIEDLGGTGSYQSCGTGCVMVTLGTAQNDYFRDTCTQIYPQQQTFRVNRPDYILSAQILEANWDDHLQISVNDAPVYTSPSWYQSKPLGGSVCELNKSWRLNTSTPCIGGGSCATPSNSVPFIDITSQMTSVAPGGLVRTNTAVIVGGGGEGFARMRILYTPPGPPPALPTDPADPKYRKCYAPDGSKK